MKVVPFGLLTNTQKGIAQYAEPGQDHAPEGVNYVDDSQIYDHDHQGDDNSRGHGSNRPQSRASQHDSDNGYGDQGHYGRRSGKEYYPYGRDSERQDHEEEDDDDMW